MRRFTRACGLAAAVLVTVFSTLDATPSLAWELDIVPVESPFPDMITTQAEPASAEPAPAAASEAPVAESRVRQSLGELVAERAAVRTDSADHECLAGAVYFEAKGEPLSGQLSVAKVILNRARSGRFPPSVCGVVKQRGQFSFVRGGRFPPIARASGAWRKAVAVAQVAMEGLAETPAGKALFFHARHVSPGWRGVTRVASIGNHVFYR